MFFDGWSGIGRVLLVGALSYAGLIAMLRISGKRTLAKMNAFDLVVTVALGSTLATVLLSKDVALLEGLTAFALLILLQFAITWMSIRLTPLQRLVKSEPRLLVSDGQPLYEAMRDERVSLEEVKSAARLNGAKSLDEVRALILETDGGFSVITGSGQGLLDTVRKP